MMRRLPSSPGTSVVRAVEWSTIVLLAMGVLFLVLPASGTVPARADSVSALGDTPGESRNSDAGTVNGRRDRREVLVRTNLFSASRRAPSQRFVPPGQEPALPLPMVEEAAGSSAPVAPQLFGIMFVGGSRRALLLAGTADSVPRVVGQGDRLGGYRVRRIETDRVELSSASGTRIVRLQRRPVSDSSGVVP